MAPQKRSAEEAESLLVDIGAILLDIEGTTTPISFVHEKLFPYVRSNIESFVTKKFDEPEVQKAIGSLRDLSNKDKQESKDGIVEISGEDANKEDIIKSVCNNVKWQMDSDRKSTELKNLQGMMWKSAYESGEIVGELFKDVGPMLKMLGEEFNLYIYSSGSEDAQKLLFRHSNFGNIESLFSGFFDTQIGSKLESSSYKKILGEVDSKGMKVLFLTDNPAEAEAANEAGMRVALVNRPGNQPLTDDQLQKFACIQRFDELYGDEEDEEDLKRFAAGNDDEDDDDDVDEDDEAGDVEEEDENADDV